MYDVVYCPVCGAEMNGPEVPVEEGRGCYCPEEEEEEIKAE